MRCCSLVALAVGVAVALPLDARAQQPARVAVLSPQVSSEPASLQREPFEQGLRELGWTPGSNIIIEYRYAEGDAERLPALATELVRRKVDAIVVRGPQAAEAARRATSTIPIVMSATPDPVGTGLVASLTRPGGNITGLSFLAEGPLNDKRLELLKEAVPTVGRIAVLSNPHALQDPDGRSENILRQAAQTLGVELVSVTVTKSADLPGALQAIGRAKVDGLLLLPDPHVFEPNRSSIVEAARERRIPAIYPWRQYVDQGGLMSYGTSIPAFHRRSAFYIDRILKGTKPGELPIEQPTKFELVVNRRAAAEIGLELPVTFLERADDVVE
jgi:putative tryptophan/tyrosine transport system substrate-binding protein